MDNFQSLVGRLLVAMPGISDPRFEHAVILVCAHEPDHAMGLRLDRPAPGIDLKDVGASLALDDFGTGFSSLSYLARLPFDTLKIDRYFVLTMDKDEGSAKIVKSVVNLGRDLSLEVVAEGVENATLAKLLLDAQCHYGQGFGYAPALPAQEAEVYLNESLSDGSAPLKARSG